MALILVIVVVGVTAVLGYVMLSSSSIQAQMSHNLVAAAGAEALAESGVELAVYQLSYLFPYYTTDYWGRNGVEVTLGPDVPGSIHITVQRLSEDEFRVVSTGRRPTGGDNQIKRTVEARVWVGKGPDIQHAASYLGDTTLELGTTIDGDALVAGTLSVGLGEVTGYVYVGGLIDSVLALLGKEKPLPDMNLIMLPGPDEINDYEIYYDEDGQAHTPQTLSSNVLSGDTLYGVFKATGDVRMEGGLRLYGTLIIEDGNLILTGTDNRIFAEAGMPGLVIIGGDIRAARSGTLLRVNGATWMSGRVRVTQPLVYTPRLDFVGPLLFGSGGIDLSLGQVNVMFDGKMNIPDLDRTLQRPVRILSWK